MSTLEETDTLHRRRRVGLCGKRSIIVTPLSFCSLEQRACAYLHVMRPNLLPGATRHRSKSLPRRGALQIISQNMTRHFFKHSITSGYQQVTDLNRPCCASNTSLSACAPEFNRKNVYRGARNLPTRNRNGISTILRTPRFNFYKNAPSPAVLVEPDTSQSYASKETQQQTDGRGFTESRENIGVSMRTLSPVTAFLKQQQTRGPSREHNGPIRNKTCIVVELDHKYQGYATQTKTLHLQPPTTTFEAR